MAEQNVGRVVGSMWYQGNATTDSAIKLQVPNALTNDLYLSTTIGNRAFQFDGTRWNMFASLGGIPGAAGQRGSLWYKGSSSTNETIKAEYPSAKLNDLYLSDNSPNFVWQFDGTDWVRTIGIKGNDGVSGPPGMPGPPGEPGSQVNTSTGYKGQTLVVNPKNESEIIWFNFLLSLELSDSGWRYGNYGGADQGGTLESLYNVYYNSPGRYGQPFIVRIRDTRTGTTVESTLSGYYPGKVQVSGSSVGNFKPTFYIEVPDPLVGKRFYLSNVSSGTLLVKNCKTYLTSLYEKAGAIFNEDTGYYSFKGATLDESQMAQRFVNSTPMYDYIVDSNVALEALDNNSTATNVLIKKGTWTSTKEVRIRNNIQTITGEGGSQLYFTSNNGLTAVNDSGGTNVFNQLITNVKVNASAYAFQWFRALYNCEGKVRTSASYGTSPFYNCGKVINCNCLAATDGGKTFATKECYNVRGCTQKTSNSSQGATHQNSYSGSTASSTYAVGTTLNGGWNE